MRIESSVLAARDGKWDDSSMATNTHDRRVLATAFLFAVFGWGMGFYGPPIFFQALLERLGASVNSVAWALTLHHLTAAFVILWVPRLHDRYGVVRVAVAATAVGTAGIVGWSVAQFPPALALSALLSGIGWGCTGGACITAVVARWYSGPRAAGLTFAYNGATIGGALFSIVWPWLIGSIGLTLAAVVVGSVACVAMATASGVALRAPSAHAKRERETPARSTPRIVADARLATLAAAMSLALFAQIGVLAHLFSLCASRLGAQPAGWLVGASVATAIGGRQLSWRVGMGRGVHPRTVFAVFVGVQALGCWVLAGSSSDGLLPLVLGCTLFGLGIGTTTSLPAVIAQSEFDPASASRAFALVLAIAQASYSFAPAAFGLLLGSSTRETGSKTSAFFMVAALIEAAAACAMVIPLARRVSTH